MSKKSKIVLGDVEKIVMDKVKSNEISMRPRLFFVLGSVLMSVGFVGLSLAAVFSINLIMFLLRPHGVMGEWRLQQILSSFPLWIPVLAIVSVLLGIFILRKYDFSYKKNFRLIIFGFVILIVMAAFLLDFSGLNETWSRQGPMRGIYRQFENQDVDLQRGQRHFRLKN